VFLTMLTLASMLPGCYYDPYHYRDDSYRRGYRHDRGHHGDRYYDDRRDGHRDYYR
jgi:hypothetical protein